MCWYKEWNIHVYESEHTDVNVAEVSQSQSTRFIQFSIKAGYEDDEFVDDTTRQLSELPDDMPSFLPDWDALFPTMEVEGEEISEEEM